ncbi:uncharacterized protein [Macrobrachium rosenbergii]|uniref:uncharacterized protein n=1 Tax=Macrobrachium rosenbergii TaxID=79674 RepID=UPI0034D3CD83
MGCSNEGFEACMGKMGVGGRMSENGVRFGSFCLANDLVIVGTPFQHHNIHKTTWVSPCGKYKNQIDHIAVSKRYGSVAKIRLKLKSQKKGKPVVDRYDIDVLRRDGEDKEEFRIKCRNRFLVVETLEEGGRSVDEMSGDVNKAFHEAAGCTIRRKLRTRKKMWMFEETWGMIKERGEAKLRSEVHFVSDEDFELTSPPEEDTPPAQEDLNIDEGEIRLEEIVKAIKQLKNYKAPGEDGLFPEMFTVEEDRLVFVLKILFNDIWVTGIIPLGWKTGVIIKVPKKGRSE